MTTLFKHHDTLRLFVEISKYGSFSEAGTALNMTKGAISYQVKTLEAELGVKLFERGARGVVLTKIGHQTLNMVKPGFLEIEAGLTTFKSPTAQSLTVGMSSYFASRWLSPRLMTFMQKHPDIQLRIQPMTELFNLNQQGIDIAVRWGNGDWDDAEIMPFMLMPAWPAGNKDAADRVSQVGAEQAFSEFTLLRDHDNSNAWSDWFDAAGLPAQTRKDTLIIPDPNVRVQSVIDGQGIALNDELVAQEIANGLLYHLSDVELTSYGYFLARPPTGNHAQSVDAFINWVR